MAENRKIDSETHLKALALFTMAKHHHDELRKYERQLGKELGILDEFGNAGRLSDSIYQDETFEQGLEY